MHAYVWMDAYKRRRTAMATSNGERRRRQRSVPSDGQEHGSPQVPRSARLFAAALERSRLPQRWKSRATAAATSLRDSPADRQDGTLKRLGRVGVVEIASSMVRVREGKSGGMDGWMDGRIPNAPSVEEPKESSDTPSGWRVSQTRERETSGGLRAARRRVDFPFRPQT